MPVQPSPSSVASSSPSFMSWAAPSRSVTPVFTDAEVTRWCRGRREDESARLVMLDGTMIGAPDFYNLTRTDGHLSYGIVHGYLSIIAANYCLDDGFCRASPSTVVAPVNARWSSSELGRARAACRVLVPFRLGDCWQLVVLKKSKGAWGAVAYNTRAGEWRKLSRDVKAGFDRLRTVFGCAVVVDAPGVPQQDSDPASGVYTCVTGFHIIREEADPVYLMTRPQLNIFRVQIAESIARRAVTLK
jgi:hypothetical protein